MEEQKNEMEEEDFFDCEETLEVLQKLKLSTKEERREERREEEPQTLISHRLKPSLQEEGNDLRPTGGDEGRTPEHTVGARPLNNLEEGEGPVEEEAEFPSEPVQVDEEYLLELEKELSDEERESRRQLSLSLKDKGNQLFKNQDWASAECVYSDALSACPLSFSADRAVLFSNRAAARVHLEKKDMAIADCSKAVELKPDYMKALLRRAELYEQTDKLDEALEDYKNILERDPGNGAARGAAVRLPPLIHERNEKLKEEMMSKLKDLGNLVLRPFGLSTSNFQLNQDQSTGAYNINFVQNPNNNNR
ncbi:unnamed protein product [Knipowitschia caucasica]